MKKITTPKKWLAAAALGLALAVSSNSSMAQGTNTTFTFDDASSTTSFAVWWGPSSPVITWDGAVDAADDPNSGSVRYDVPFAGAKGDQFMTFFTIANRWQWDGGTVIDASTYTNLTFQVLVDPTSGKRTGNDDYGNYEFGFVSGSWAANPVGNVTFPAAASNHWVTFNIPLNSGIVGIDQVAGFYIKMWSDGVMPSEVIFNIDNFKLTKPDVVVVVPNPTTSIVKAYPGLQLTATAAAGQYGRQSIHTVSDNLSWVDQGKPVSYSLQIKDAPGSSASGFQTHVFFTPTASSPYGIADSPVDWNARDIFWLNIKSAGASLMYKTNQPSGNTMAFNSNPTNGPVGSLANLDCPSPIGIWTLTFNNNTSITLTAPNGASTNVTISAESAAMFANPLFIDVGTQPNDVVNYGLSSTITRFWTTNTATDLDYTFTGSTLDTTVWGLAAGDASGIISIPDDARFWFRWTLPASSDSFVLGATNITGKWTDLGLTNVLQSGTIRQTLVTTSALPSTSASFFALGKRTFTRLLVVLPGETFAPGTATGKTGTPDDQTWGTDFVLTVYAVDSTFNLVKTAASDTIHVVSSDPNAIIAADAPLTNGKVTFTVSNFTLGSNTFTVSDVTDSTKTSGTSAPVICN